MPQEHKNNLLWRASSNPQRLRQRAALIKKIREFFELRDVLEVETPALSQSTITDVHLEALQSAHRLPGASEKTPLFLQTSPEFAMKRLLCDGFGDIFQICKCFREDEIGALHNPEFTMLEWYRLGFSMQNLIDEVTDLLKLTLGENDIKQLTYEQAFIDYLEFSPAQISNSALIEYCQQHSLADYVGQLQQSQFSDTPLKDALLQALFSQAIEPVIAQKTPVCVTHFPASQAALAKLDDGGDCALRFEFYYKGIELANGFEELDDPKAQRMRFENDNQQRQRLQKAIKPIDERFLAALENGLPACSGVALGLDRLLMLAMGCEAISDVISFDISRA